MKLYNTLSRAIEDFKPIKEGEASLYTCGPTVYNYAHIGNLRTYIFEDLLKRTLLYNGYKVKHAMNITDVGHLVGDGDEGEDKLEVGAKREGKNPLDIAKFYTDKFFQDTDALNIIRPDVVKSATETIEQQKDIIKILVEKGFAYKGEQAVYFDTSKLADYGKLSGQKLSEKLSGAREEVVVDKDKKNPADFALWFFLTGRYKNHILHWPSPWGEGFPGWHIECSAISREILGQPFDIHCGGVDHIGTHHTNEIAQSEAAFGVPLANVWMHGEFLQVNEGKMAKSAGTFITLDDLKQKGYSPLYYRYLCLSAHYRTQLNFTWESLESAKQSLEKIYDYSRVLLNTTQIEPSQDLLVKLSQYKRMFAEAIDNDLNAPQALAVVHKFLDDKKLPNSVKMETMLGFGKVLGLKFSTPIPRKFFVELSDSIKISESVSVDIIEDIKKLPEEVQKMVYERRKARSDKDFERSDSIRQKMEALGYEVLDTPEGQKIKRKISL